MELSSLCPWCGKVSHLSRTAALRSARRRSQRRYPGPASAAGMDVSPGTTARPLPPVSAGSRLSQMESI